MKNRLVNILAAGLVALLVGAIAYSQLAPRAVTAASGDSNYTSVVASTDVAAPVIYDLYSSSTGYGYRRRTFATTLSSGTGPLNFGSGIEPVGCVGYYNQSTVRSFAINFGHVAAQRTMTIKLGGGGTTGDAIAGHCITKEIR